MKPLTVLLGLPISAPLMGLGWLTRRIAEAVEREMDSAASVQAELLALERLLDAGDIDMVAFEAEESRLLAVLQAIEANAAENADEDEVA